MKRKHSRLPVRVVVAALTGSTVLILWLTVNSDSIPTKPVESRSSEVTNVPKPEAPKAKSSNWVRISYGGLVDGSAITHSGKAVAEVVQNLSAHDERLRGLVQQSLEPFSLLCHDVVMFRSKADTIPYVNITSHYPIGSAQPAWADLFREGHFQLYYNPYLIRLFLKGSDPKESFNKCQSVVRHAIQDFLECQSDSIKKLEVYVFSNDYASMEIRLNTVPTVFAIDTVDLSAKHNTVASARSRMVLMPKTKWTVTKLTQGATRYNYRLGSGDLASVSISPNQKQWESRLRISGQQDMIKVSKNTNLMLISHPGIKGDIVGKISLDGRRVVFSR